MSQKYEKLKGLLKELFQLDQPDLDFGLYRIMHAKSAEVTQFLEKDLLPQVTDAFRLYKTADKAELEKELAKAIEQANSLGADPDTLPKVKELRQRLANDAVDVGALENEVYDHLFSFFRRYYSEGDFLAKRVYKPGVYSIPYEGEEVKLHWANQDQFYIKTSEYLLDYAFRLRPDDAKNPMPVHFCLADVEEGEHGNIHASDGKDRVFILAPGGESRHDFITVDEGEQGKELHIHFQYRAASLNDWPEEIRVGKAKPPAQKDLISAAVKRILGIIDPLLTVWIAELSTVHFTASGEKAEYSRLEANLRRYAARNTFDYFIHKDLQTFLNRELDFYIKNEIMHLDDIESETAPRVEQYLSKIRVIRRVARKLIAFLGQLEDFQKKLWLKRKFVVETYYCVTVGCVPENLLAEVAANDAQREEWVKLCGIHLIERDLTQVGYSAPLKPEFLRAHSTLVLDTRHYSQEFGARLLQALGNLGEITDGVLVHGENFQALRMLGRCLKAKCDVIYIDPPYNTDASAIAYKNDYKDSSWLALMENRLSLSHKLLRSSGVTCIAIDDTEFAKLRCLIDASFGSDATLGVAAVRSNPAGRSTPKGFAEAHEYAVFVAASDMSSAGRMPRNERQLARYSERDSVGRFELVNFRKHGGREATRQARPRMYFPIFAINGVVRLPAMEWSASSNTWVILEQPLPGEEAVWPLNDSGQELRWKWGSESFAEEVDHFCARPDQAGKTGIYMKSRMNEEGMLPVTWWDDKEYSATEYGTNLLTRIFGRIADFSFPKALRLVVDCLRASNVKTDSTVLDYFAGSGTTGHAVINLNREDGNLRRFVLVETGNHFDAVLLPRIKKVIFSPEWANGLPSRPTTAEEADRSPRVVKVVRIESYEDALNNLDIRRTDTQQSLLDASPAQGADGLREQYILRYMLDVESRGSQSLLNIKAFTDPVAYRLRVKLPGSDESREVNVDLLETFNWLIGLTVQSIAVPQTFAASFERDSENRLQLKGKLKPDAVGPWWFRIVEGATPEGRKTLIVWRKLTGDLERDNLVLDVWMKDRLKISTKDFEFDLIYVNGDNNLENLRLPDDTWKVRLIEEDFHRLMFDTEGL